MHLEYESATEIQQEIMRAVRKHLPDERYHVFIFGSRVAGTHSDRSDIDVGIEGPRPVGGGIMSAIEEDIEELDTLYSIDIVDFFHLPEKFKRVVGDTKEYLTTQNL
jgi:uncharacterized protein